MNCWSKYIIHLIECTKCKLQYFRKAERELNLTISNHRKNALNLNAIPADQHCVQRDDDFNTDPKLIIIEQLQNAKLGKESITDVLKKRDNFWIKKLETLHSKGPNHELN